MKKSVIVLFFCFLGRNGFAGCPGPQFHATIGNFGLSSNDNYNTSYVVYAIPSDSFLLTLSSKCYVIESAGLSFDGQSICNSSQGKVTTFFKLPCTPGVYVISAKILTGSCWWKITIIAKPKVAEPTPGIPDTAATTALPPVKILNPEFLFYPNPAHDELTLLNETDEIRSVAFYDQWGQLFSTFEVKATEIRMPLNNFPPGIYFMHVATLSNEIIIKKISKL